MEIVFATNVDPDQTPHYVASDLGLHCFSQVNGLIKYHANCDSTATDRDKKKGERCILFFINKIDFITQLFHISFLDKIPNLKYFNDQSIKIRYL